MSNLTKIIIVFIVSIISYVLGYIAYKDDEYSPFVFIFLTIGSMAFIVSLVGFLII